MTAKEKVVVLLGPTATGKSFCGLEIAKRLGGEIISGDSMLVYKGMNIATAKPTEEELKMVPHHLVNILEPEAAFNVVDFKNRAAALITEITSRGKLPIIVGGTGLYLKALLEDYNFSQVGVKSDLRQQLEEMASRDGRLALHQKLEALSPEAAAKLPVNDIQRVIRAIEVALEGDKVSEERSGTLAYDAQVFGLTMDRAKLYERINQRVEAMVTAGIFEETKGLMEQGVPLSCQSMRSIGYRQIAQYYQGEFTREEAIEKLKQATRNFAKRQLTWYRQMPYIHWFDLSTEPNYQEIIRIIINYLN